MASPNATFMGEVQGEKLARSVTQIFSSLKTEALTQDILLHDGSSVGEGIWGDSVCGSVISVTE